jgi:KipI family sensor histidine kinase inhibitor
VRRLGVYVRLGDRVDLEVNEQVQRLGRRVLDDLHPGVTDVQPSYAALYVEYDARRAERAEIEAWLRGHVEAARAGGADSGGTFVRMPVRYDGEDVAAVCEATGLARHELIDLHSGRDYRVFAVGASPGFPFLGVLDERLRMARHPAPRAIVPAHAVAMTGLQTGIYPVPGPGGWQLLGHALRAVYDPWREQPFLIAPGDTVRFEPADGEVPPEPTARPLLPARPERPALRVDETGLLDLVVDGGRDMGGRFGMAQTGPADARSARLANALVGNDANEPVLELTVRGASLTALRPVRIAIAGPAVVPWVGGQPAEALATLELATGDRLSLPHTGQGARSYLALAGGIESERFMGSASTDVRGLVGRPLAVGDALGTAREVDSATRMSARVDWPVNGATVRILPGPQASRAALERLDGAELKVAAGDRTGVRFEGAEIPGGESVSEPPPLGAVQITPSGEPFVLLVDRYRTGGYSKPAVVHPDDLPIIGQLLPGMQVRFALVEPGLRWDLSSP